MSDPSQKSTAQGKNQCLVWLTDIPLTSPDQLYLLFLFITILHTERIIHHVLEFRRKDERNVRTSIVSIKLPRA